MESTAKVDPLPSMERGKTLKRRDTIKFHDSSVKRKEIQDDLKSKIQQKAMEDLKSFLWGAQGKIYANLSANTVNLALSKITITDLFVSKNGGNYRFMIHPKNKYLAIWDAVVAFKIILIVFLLPVRISFYWWLDNAYTNFIGALTDSMSTIDIILHFRTGIIENNEIIMDPIIVAKHYLKTWFIIDLLGIFPFSQMSVSVSVNTQKSVKYLKYFRLPKLLRAVRLARVIQKHSKYFGVIVNFLGFSLSLQLLTCLWVSVVLDCEITPEYCQDSYLLRVYMESLYLTLGSMFLNSNLQDWKRSPYFTLYNLENQEETLGEVHFIGVITMLVGFFFSATLLSNVNNMIQSINSDGQLFQTKISKFKRELEYYELPKSLSDRVNVHYEYLWYNRRSFSSMTLLQDKDISPQLKRDIQISIYRNRVEQVPYFNRLHDDNFIDKVCTFVDLSIHLPGDHIFYKGDEPRDFYIINKGSVCIIDEEEEDHTAVLFEGSFFGEMGLLFGKRRSKSARALSTTEICSLSKKAFEELRTSYPKFDLILKTVIARRDVSSGPLEQANIASNDSQGFSKEFQSQIEPKKKTLEPIARDI